MSSMTATDILGAKAPILLPLKKKMYLWPHSNSIPTMAILSGCRFWMALLGAIHLPVLVWAQPTFTLNGSALALSENCYRITSNKTAYDVGSIWCEFPLQLENAFDIHFAVNLGCTKYAGEGVAFVMHTHANAYDALGCSGAAMGFGQVVGSTCLAIKPSLALEIDSRYNRSHSDILQPHLALVKDGNLAVPLVPAVAAAASGQEVLDCEYHDVRIHWLPSQQKLDVYFDGVLRLSYKGDIAQTVFGGAENIYFGFTGSSSQLPNMQMICVQSVTIELDEAFSRRRSFEEGVGIYTNPLREKLTVDLQFEREEYIQLQLYDSSGRLIYEVPTHSVRENQYYFNLPGLPSGVYYVTVTNGTQRVSKKIVHISTIRA